MDSDTLEERCLVDEGEAILNKKAVYEPTKGQRFQQIVCTKAWALCILTSMALVIIAVAAMAAFARPGLMSPSETCEMPTKPTVNGSHASSQPQKMNYTATNGNSFPWHNIRLPKSIVPQNYDIFLHPNIEASSFKGRVNITVKVVETTDFIVFHTAELKHTAVQVFLVKEGWNVDSESHDQTIPKSAKETIGVVKELEFVAYQQLYVKLDRAVEPGRLLELQLGFTGSLANLAKMNGFYKSSYTVNNQQRFMASTQFEASNARNAFPCFDEPALKADFAISIVRDKNHITLFNTPLNKTSPYDNDLVVDHYKRTVRMSTYLVAYVVCDFKSLTAKTKDGVTVRVFAPEDKIYMGQYALDAAVKIIDFYNEFFGIPYPLSKQDLIAIPNFAAGAMENWGLITYRDTAILYDPNMSTEGAKLWVAEVVAHELAHQWFGNLVTMKWWNDLWLNEGFATYMEFIGADALDKEFHALEEYMGSFTDALFLDSLSSSHPIEVPIKNPTDVEAAFDRISYDKGACLIHMLRNFIGKTNFKKGLSHYLRQHSYGNAETKDLWDSFGEASKLPSDIDVNKVMNTWTQQMGYPVVTVTQKAGKLFLSQERFLWNKETAKAAKMTSPFGYKWHIPFMYTTSDDSVQPHLVWMKMGPAETTLPVSSSPMWVKGNAKSRGFYRVNYDESGWTALIKQLKTDHNVFSVEDRVGLVDDAFSLAWTSAIDYSVALDMSLYLLNEDNFHVWGTAMHHFTSLVRRLYLHESYDNLKSLMLYLSRHLIDSLGWEDKGDHLERKMRSLMIDNAFSLQYQPAVDQAKSFFELWKANESVSLNNDLRGVIYAAGVKYGTKKEWDLVFERFHKCKVPSERIILLSTLSAPHDARILQILMDYSLDNSKIKSQDTNRVMSSVASNPVGFLYAWRFLRENWNTFFERYGHGSFTMSSLIKNVVHDFSTQFDYDEVCAFFEGKELGSATLALEQAKEVIKSHITWEKNNLDKVNAWLQDPSRNFNQKT